MNFAAAYFAYVYYKKKKGGEEKKNEESKTETPSAAPVKQAEDLIEAFHCPISQQLIEEPVSSKYGHIYEKAEIERWVSKFHTCPMTN
jgi:hypothetical protein